MNSLILALIVKVRKTMLNGLIGLIVGKSHISILGNWKRFPEKPIKELSPPLANWLRVLFKFNVFHVVSMDYTRYFSLMRSLGGHRF